MRLSCFETVMISFLPSDACKELGWGCLVLRLYDIQKIYGQSMDGVLGVLVCEL